MALASFGKVGDKSAMFLKREWYLRAAATLAVGLAVAAGFGVWSIWDWLQADEESNGATLRNIALVLAAVVALPLALWRSLVAQRQADTAQRGLLNERYQKGAEMLGSSVLSVRLGGIYALRNLAEEHPQQYAVQILRLFCAFVRHPTKDADKRPKNEAKSYARVDVQAIMEVIGARDDLFREVDAGVLNLQGANLAHTDLSDAGLSWTILSGANLSGAWLSYTDLSHVAFDDANLTDAKLKQADLSRSELDFANLTGANLDEVTGMTQNQLDLACADPSNPPHWSEETLDAETNRQLVWQGRPLKGDG